MGAAEKKLQELGIILPEMRPPVANYVPAVRTGNLLFLSGVHPGREARRHRSTGQARRRPVGRGGLRGGPPGRNQPAGRSQDHPRRSRQGQKGRQTSVDGQLDTGLHRYACGGQWMLRPHGRGIRRQWQTRPLGRRHGQPAAQHTSRDRDGGRGPRLISKRRAPLATSSSN